MRTLSDPCAFCRNSHLLPVRYPAPPRPRSRAVLICSMTPAGFCVDEDLVEGLVAADRDVLLDVVGVDEAAVAQHDLDLAVEEGDLVPEGHVRVAGPVAHVPGEVVPLLDLAEHQLLGGRRAVGKPVEDAVHVVGLDTVQHEEGVAGQPEVDERLLRTEAEAAHGHEVHGQAARVDGGGEGAIEALRAVAGAAGAHADGDARARGDELGEARLADGREPGEVGDPHRARPRRSDSTSRMRACSVTWPRMA